MAKNTTRPHSYDYTARTNPRRYLLSGIPPELWARVRAQAKREHLSVRWVILNLLDGWLSPERVQRRMTTQAAMQRAISRSREIAASQAHD